MPKFKVGDTVIAVRPVTKNVPDRLAHYIANRTELVIKSCQPDTEHYRYSFIAKGEASWCGYVFYEGELEMAFKPLETLEDLEALYAV